MADARAGRPRGARAARSNIAYVFGSAREDHATGGATARHKVRIVRTVELLISILWPRGDGSMRSAAASEGILSAFDVKTCGPTESQLQTCMARSMQSPGRQSGALATHDPSRTRGVCRRCVCVGSVCLERRVELSVFVCGRRRGGGKPRVPLSPCPSGPREFNRRDCKDEDDVQDAIAETHVGMCTYMMYEAIAPIDAGIHCAGLSPACPRPLELRYGGLDRRPWRRRSPQPRRRARDRRSTNR